MGYYTADELYAYDFLADRYAICDRWFASHPGHTWPNRFVSLTGRLAPGPDGRPQIDNPDLATFDPLEVSTIFDHLLAAGVEWRYFEHDLSMLRLFSKYTFDRERIVNINDPLRGFFALARAGRLPPVSWIEPNLTDIPPGNDDHPPSDVRDGQALVERIYRALRTSPNWGRTMLIITYDEHGGFFDHVHPERQQLFDPRNPEAGGFVPLGFDESERGRRTPIDFYGMRVPTFVVSPWVPSGHVSSDVFDHTSILKTIIAAFLHENPPDMGNRVALANHLGPLLSNDIPRVEPVVAMVDTAGTTRERRADRRPPPTGNDDFRRFVSEFRLRRLAGDLGATGGGPTGQNRFRRRG
jgi:phospholipase C